MARKSKSALGMTMALAAVVVLAGIGTGYALHAFFPIGGSAGSSTTVPVTLGAEQIEVGGVYGAQDEQEFPDLAEGVLVKGGIEGEGSHHLVRPGGKNQYVYLTSTVLDLDLFEGARIKVWGETFDAQKAGWLMDAGRVEVTELRAELPPGEKAEPLPNGDE
jgi:hypothetical protein